MNSIRLRFVAGLWMATLLVAAARGQTPTALPDYPAQMMLIKNTVTAVNHGNITGNFTVLRDLGSERFRRAHTAADLAITFANLKGEAQDLSPILVTEPRLTMRPVEDLYRRLQLVGYFPTRPKAVRFALLFQPVDGGWMIDEISLSVAPIESLTPQERPAQRPPDSSAAGQSGEPFVVRSARLPNQPPFSYPPR